MDGLVNMNLCKKQLESKFSILFSPFSYIFFISWFITFSTLESFMSIIGFWRKIELQFSKFSPFGSVSQHFFSHSKEEQLAQSICAKKIICQINLKSFHMQFPKKPLKKNPKKCQCWLIHGNLVHCYRHLVFNKCSLHNWSSWLVHIFNTKNL